MIMMRETGWPPGGFLFTDSRTGEKFDAPGDSLRDVVNKVIALRVANPRVFDPSTDVKMLLFDFVRSEVAEQNCARLGNDPAWCFDTDYKPEVPKSLAKDKCDCGVPLVPNTCRTCGGGRVVSYTCPECKQTYSV